MDLCNGHSANNACTALIFMVCLADLSALMRARARKHFSTNVPSDTATVQPSIFVQAPAVVRHSFSTD